MPLENATNIPELVVTNPASGDGAGSTDDHLKLIKGAVKGSFPNFDGAENVTLSEAEINALPQDIVNAVAAVADDRVPVGLISLWSGSIASIPTNWALCDGTNGTPNLQDRFIVGAGDSYAVGASGGANSKTTSSEAVGFSNDTGGTALTQAQLPDYDLTLSCEGRTATTAISSGGLLTSYTSPSNTTLDIPSGGSGQTHDHSIPDSDPHSHSVDVRPPYYALAYIMKVA